MLNEKTQNKYSKPPALQNKKLTDENPKFEETPLSFADQKMVQAYGFPMLNTEGEWKNDMWENIWKRTVALRGKLYTLPGGVIGQQFVSTLAAEVFALS